MTTLNRRAFLGVTPFAAGATLQTFEVVAGADGAMKAAPLAAMGRFVHEAVAVDAQM